MAKERFDTSALWMEVTIILHDETLILKSFNEWLRENMGKKHVPNFL